MSIGALGREIYQFGKAKFTARDGQSREYTRKIKEIWGKKLEMSSMTGRRKTTIERGNGDIWLEARGEPKEILRKGKEIS